MDSERLGGSSSVNIDKLNKSHFHVWKKKVNLVLMDRKVDDVVEEQNPHVVGTLEYRACFQCDMQAHALIGLSLSDEMSGHISRASTARDMLESVHNVFQHHTLLDRLRVQREFSTLEMRAWEEMISYINCVQHLWSMLKSMGVEKDSNEMVVAILNQLTRQYDNIITVLDDLRMKVPSLLLKVWKEAFYRTNSHETWKDLWRKRKQHSWAVTAKNLGGGLEANTATAGGTTKNVARTSTCHWNQTTFKWGIEATRGRH